MKFRAVDYSRIIREDRPIRAGWSVKDEVIKRVATRKSMAFVGRIPKEWLPAAEQPYGDVLITRVYTGSGHVFGHVKQVDLAGN